MDSLKQLWETFKDLTDENDKNPWKAIYRIGFVVSTFLIAAPEYITFLKPNADVLSGIGYLVAAVTALVIGSKILRPIVQDIDKWVASSALASWTAASLVGTLYGNGWQIHTFTRSITVGGIDSAINVFETAYALERYGRFILLSLPIGILCSIFTAGILGSAPSQATKKVFSLSFSLLFLGLAVGFVAFVSSRVLELGLASKHPSLPIHPPGANVIKLGTMDFVLYPMLTLAVCLVCLLCLRRIWESKERALTTWIGAGAGLWTILSVLKWSVWDGDPRGELARPGTGLGLGIVLISLAVSMCWVAIGLVRAIEHTKRPATHIASD